MKGTKAALMKWEQIPHGVRLKLLNNVWCSRCRCARSMAEAHVVLKRGDFLIQGHCVTCNADIVRYVDI